jgi:hypothetical protein
MLRRALPWILVALIAVGCSTTYVYHGNLQAEDSDGVTRDHIIYWLKTDRRFWFDGAEGAVRILTECMPSTLAFDEREEGIVFRRTPTDEGVTGDIPLGEPCGVILTAKKVKDLPEGTIEVKIYCRHVVDEFEVGLAKAYLKARDTPYAFDVRREPNGNFPGGAPKFDCAD